MNADPRPTVSEQISRPVDLDEAAAQTKPLGEPPTANAIKEAYERWEELLDMNHLHQETIKNHEQTIMKLSTDIDSEKTKSRKLQAERDAYQMYAVGLQTRLTAIKEQIEAAERATIGWMAKAKEEQETKEVAPATEGKPVVVAAAP